MDAIADLALEPGKSFPLGATLLPGGANFSVFSKHASAVQLLLFDDVEDERPAKVIDLDPRERTYHYWHVFVPGLQAGQLYGYRVHGASNVLLDPYGKCVARSANTAVTRKSVVADVGAYDWEDDRRPCTPFAKTIIYELHVGNFTRHPSSGVDPARRGTFAGLIEKIPYLHDLGVSAVELLPVFAFDETSAPPGHHNVWGYQPLAFFAPHPGYSSRTDPLGALDEFRDLVKAAHRAGIEIILDVVYNHTAEGGAEGPTLSFRGLANDTYYLIDATGANFVDYSGTGNTLNANDPIVRRLILDSLRYWVAEMHVDGFRFDLASVMSRDEQGHPVPSPPVLLDIESDPILANVKLIAEPWDAAGLYQVGGFAGDAWKEWNGRFRDDVRRFLKGDSATVRSLASRLVGSPDIYGAQGREPEQSINFVTCHDGFTLNDLVSYDHKHNEANGESNRDGSDVNHSWNCGVEGETQDDGVEQLRKRQIKNFFTLTLFATGTPMLLMGDEIRRTQRGNNNAYCLDDETTWFDWSALTRNADLHRFVTQLIALRNAKALPLQRVDVTLNELIAGYRIEWHGVALGEADWGDDSHSLAATFRFEADAVAVHLMINAYWKALAFAVPELEENYLPWRRCLDTFRGTPEDVCRWTDAPAMSDATFVVQPRSIVMLVTRSGTQEPKS